MTTEESKYSLEDSRKLLGWFLEIQNLRAELDKTKKIIDIVERMQLGQQPDTELFEALKEYRGETE